MAEGAADRTEIIQWLVRTLSDQLSQVFDTMAGESPLIEAESPAAAPTSGEAGSLLWEVSLNICSSEPIWLHAPKASWYGLGNRVLLAAGLDDSDDQTIQDTFKEAIDQAFAGLAREMTGKAGREVTAASGKLSTATPPAGTSWNRLELVFSDNQPSPMIFGFNEELFEKLSPKPAAAPAAKASQPATAVAAAAGGGGGGAQGGFASRPSDSRTLDLLLDVELPISVSFGRAHLPLKEVMKLTTGSIVELNRTISEPVDIIVNNCVIARGEVVVVEGNFGVRIQEVVSRQERLRTLY
jgi:flagellar motor switch protein FliN/FliY